MDASLAEEMVIFWLKRYLWSLISKMKVTCMPIPWVLFCLFVAHAFFFGSLVVVYVCILPSWKVFRTDKSAVQKTVIFFNKCIFWSIITKWKVTHMPIDSFMFSLSNVNPFFSVLKSWHTYAHSHPNTGSKLASLQLKKWSYFAIKSSVQD